MKGPASDSSSGKLVSWQRSPAPSIETYRLLSHRHRGADSIAERAAEGVERPAKAGYLQFICRAERPASETRPHIRRHATRGGVSPGGARAVNG